MITSRGCGWWCAVVRLSLAPRWHRLARLIAAYPLIAYQLHAKFPLLLMAFFRLVPSWCQISAAESEANA